MFRPPILGKTPGMDQDNLFSNLHLDPEDNLDHDVVELQGVQEVKIQGERLLEESRSLTRASRALLDEIDHSAV